MVRIIGMYRWAAGATFDHDYYRDVHMPLTRDVLAPHGLLRLESDHYIAAAPAAGQIIAVSHAYFGSLQAAQAATAAVRDVLRADLRAYTDLTPEILVANVTTHLR